MNTRRLEWRKVKVDDGAYEAAGVLDVNNDGKLDILCGGFWYQAPDWKKHKVCDVRAEREYYDDFSTIPMDVNGDGYMDVVTGGWFGQTLVWRENPKGQAVEWKTHEIAKCSNIETTRAWDIDGDGDLEVVPNLPNGPLMIFKLIKDQQGKGTGQFRQFVVSQEKQGHGLGFGTIGGKKALILYNGWWEAPADPLNGQWTWRPEFELGRASIPIITADLNRDGLEEVIVGQAHGYGLDYWQQKVEGGKRTWTKHPIDPFFSQYHDMQWADIDNDGECELITGNRYRAHNGHDVGETDIVGLFYFKWTGENFVKNVIDFGKVGNHSGAGIHFAVADLDGDGRLDIVAPGKEGLYVFFNLGPETVGKK
jgi:hypothetical protein